MKEKKIEAADRKHFFPLSKSNSRFVVVCKHLLTSNILCTSFLEQNTQVTY